MARLYCSPRWMVSASFSRCICLPISGAAMASAIKSSAAIKSRPSSRYPCSAVLEERRQPDCFRGGFNRKCPIFRVRRSRKKVAVALIEQLRRLESDWGTSVGDAEDVASRNRPCRHPSGNDVGLDILAVLRNCLLLLITESLLAVALRRHFIPSFVVLLCYCKF